MNAIANGWQGAVLNLGLILGMLYSPSQRVEMILFTAFVLLSILTVRILLHSRRRKPPLRGHLDQHRVA